MKQPESSPSSTKGQSLLNPLLRKRELRNLLCLAGFEGAELSLLLRHGRVLRFAPGDLLTRVGGHDRRLLLLLEGSVAARRRDGEGAVLNASYEAPEVVGEISVFGPRHYQVADVEALTLVTAVVFPLFSRAALLDGAPVLMSIVESRSAPRLESLAAAAENERAERQVALGLYYQALDRVHSRPL